MKLARVLPLLALVAAVSAGRNLREMVTGLAPLTEGAPGEIAPPDSYHYKFRTCYGGKILGACPLGYEYGYFAGMNMNSADPTKQRYVAVVTRSSNEKVPYGTLYANEMEWSMHYDNIEERIVCGSSPRKMPDPKFNNIVDMNVELFDSLRDPSTRYLPKVTSCKWTSSMVSSKKGASCSFRHVRQMFAPKNPTYTCTESQTYEFDSNNQVDRYITQHCDGHTTYELSEFRPATEMDFKSHFLPCGKV